MGRIKILGGSYTENVYDFIPPDSPCGKPLKAQWQAVPDLIDAALDSALQPIRRAQVLRSSPPSPARTILGKSLPSWVPTSFAQAAGCPSEAPPSARQVLNQLRAATSTLRPLRSSQSDGVSGRETGIYGSSKTRIEEQGEELMMAKKHVLADGDVHGGAGRPRPAAVDLSTLPTRESTQLTIYNSEDITMVREHRLLTVKEGVNRIQFSWANTLIDPTSIEFRILDQQDKVDLVDTTFPAGRNDALQWNIKSQIAGKIPVEIRYFTSGITWAADYVGIANEDETKLNLTGYVRVTNGSGEQYDNAETRLVVGKINLVEKIADLARRPPPGREFRRCRR